MQDDDDSDDMCEACGEEPKSCGSRYCLDCEDEALNEDEERAYGPQGAPASMKRHYR
jgi:hypothetical protein